MKTIPVVTRTCIREMTESQAESYARSRMSPDALNRELIGDLADRIHVLEENLATTMENVRRLALAVRELQGAPA